MIIVLQALLLFRNSLSAIIEQYLEPYFSKVLFNKSDDKPVDEDNEDEVFAEYDDNKGVVFYPPVYAQRYAAVSDCLLDKTWCGRLEKVVDFGCNDMSFIRYMKDIPGVKEILGVDLEALTLRCTADLKCDKYSPKRENPLRINLFQGNAADPDYRLIGCDAVVAIELIEHMMPHDLDRFVHNVFGFIKPWIAVITTPNGDFNPLFKALEKNGLRRLDHMFEWTREQFHDWCSNIVSRYPQYTVSCKGVGPGPAGTAQLGCCSQLALFVATDYHKQPDLDINSLALVARVSSAGDMDTDSWDDESITERNMLCAPNRLNCTNQQVRNFSKATHNLMARNNLDSLVNAREIVDEIRHLSNMLNFNKKSLESPTPGHIWNNTNWGENAPYWNQYYKIVREYKYPFEVKSEESRILEVISDEINRLIDTDSAEWFARGDSKMEIPIDYLMKVVGHITSDEEKVRELLEWNGYDVAGDVVVYSRLVVEAPESLTEDWVDVDPVSDLATTDAPSITTSEGVPESDLYDRGLRRALDQKIRSLRKLTKNEDISAELERVVCRLIQLALETHGGLKPPPSTWLLNKLYDLLTLTENAMTRRNKLFAEDSQKAIEDRRLHFPNGIEDDLLADSILETYQGVLANSDEDKIIKYFHEQGCQELTDTDSNNTKLIAKCNDEDTVHKLHQENQDLFNAINEVDKKETVNQDIEKELTNMISPFISSTNVNSNTIDMNIDLNNCEKKISLECLPHMDIDDSNDENEINKYNQNENLINKSYNELKKGHANCLKTNKLKIVKRNITKMPSYLNFFKYHRIEYHKFKLEVQNQQDYLISRSSSKPIPEGQVNFSQCDSSTNKYLQKFGQSSSDCNSYAENEISHTQKSMFMKIVSMDGEEEVIAFRRTVGTDPDLNLTVLDTNVDVEKVINITKVQSLTCHEKICVGEDSALFLGDISEPSTSEGIRRFTTDSQCGPDESNDFKTELPIINNLADIKPKRRYSSIKIGDSVTNLEIKKLCDFGTSISRNDFSNKNSNATIIKEQNCCTVSHDESKTDQSSLNQIYSNVKPASCVIKSDDSDCLPKIENFRSRELSYGGIYVHCFKDKRNSEDIVYQGQWQRYSYNPANIAKKNPLIYYTKKKDFKIEKKVVFTERSVSNYTLNNNMHVKCKKVVTIRNPKLANTRKTSKTKLQNHRTIQNGAQPSKEINCRKYRKPTISKVSSKVTTSIVLKKSNKPRFFRKPVQTSTPVKKLNKSTDIHDVKNYIPAYLRKRINKYSKNNNRYSNSNFVSNKYKARKTLEGLNSQNAGDTKSLIYNVPQEIQRNLSYIVYRNEQDSENNASNAAPEEENINSYVSNSLPDSPVSYSPCSSPNSVGTVRKVTFRNKVDYNINHSTYSERSSSENYDPANDTNKNRKIVRKFKSYKKPNTSTASSESKDNLMSPRESYKDKDLANDKRNDDTIKTQIYPHFMNLGLCKNKLQGSIDSNVILKSTPYPKGSHVAVNKSIILNRSESKSFNSIPTANEHFAFVNNSVKFSTQSDKDDTHDSVERDIKQLIEENLNNMKIPSENNFTEANNSHLVPLDIYTIDKTSSNLTYDIYDELIDSEEKTESCSNNENENYKNSYADHANTCSETANGDLFSLKSTASKTTSRFSEYFSADNELLSDDFWSQTNIISSVQNAFDIIQNMSNNDDTRISLENLNDYRRFDEYTDLVNSVDSETGSRVEEPGNTSTEEIESGRSSENTYETCSLDEDSPIPYWLFETDSEPDQIVPMSLPVVEPELDLNANVMEPVVVGAGAGDGRGIHSDVSRDSSGRGTSLSSSGTSSGLESQETLSNLSDSDQNEPLLELQDVLVLVLPGELLDTVVAPGDYSRTAPLRNPVIVISNADEIFSSDNAGDDN